MLAIRSCSNELQKLLDRKNQAVQMQKNKKWVLTLGIQIYQVLTTDEVWIPSLFSTPLAVCKSIQTTKINLHSKPANESQIANGPIILYINTIL